ncbi:hypothetical protein CGX12_11815 [Zobellella denitrificans]|uniref:hypothetical protein n=1 Tax=Zobellella denitrificans TaxID=347534 RepID=UPI000B8BEA77|nr:hypothetical protein [Zobellella denitrificans]OXS14900.1 hypothetical protein CGX12_11815 [Zobellella denitrificans]
MNHITTARLLRVQAPVCTTPLRPEVITHRHRPGFVERQDGSWICLPVQHNRKRRIHRRRRLWDWLAGVLGTTAPGGAA